jgi:predicted metal-dependent peptidase
MKRDDDPILAKLIKARVQLLFAHPFFASLCLRLRFVPAAIETMETDGRTIYYSEKYVESLSPAELEGVLAHEALHCALGHHCRRGRRTPERWNDACDYAVNPIILANQLILPSVALVKKEYEGLSAEEIYAKLPPESPGGGGSQTDHAQAGEGSLSSQPQPQEPQQNSQNGGSNQRKKQPPSKPQTSTGNAESDGPTPGTNPAQTESTRRSGGIGDVRDAVDENDDPASEAEKSEQAQDWAIAAEQAAQSAKNCGHQPLGVDRLLQDSKESKKDWRAILRDFVAATTPSDYRFCPPNRRHVHAGLYLPSIHREGLGPIVIGVDTSGSIGREELQQFADEIAAIAEQAHPEVIHVVFCDAAVQAVQEFSSSETIMLKPKGSGGTDFRPVFEWVEENDVRPVCLIYLTDLCCSGYPDSQPEYPVLWVTDSHRVAPFGETLPILAD